MAKSQSTSLTRFFKGLPECAGIYAIRHVESDRRYIGSTNNLRRRLPEHVRRLRKGAHETPHLQYAFNKHGEAAFALDVLETCLDAALILIAREDVWIVRHKGNLYNSREAAEQFSQEWHRSEEGKAFHARRTEKVIEWWQDREGVEIECERCGKPFVSRGLRRARYCSVNCFQAALYHSGSRHEDRPCAYCGKPFKTLRCGDSRFCSSACFKRSRCRLVAEDIIPIIERAVAGERLADIAASYDVHRSAIDHILRRDTWREIELPPDLEEARLAYFSPEAKSARFSRAASMPSRLEALKIARSYIGRKNRQPGLFPDLD